VELMLFKCFWLVADVGQNQVEFSQDILLKASKAKAYLYY